MQIMRGWVCHSKLREYEKIQHGKLHMQKKAIIAKVVHFGRANVSLIYLKDEGVAQDFCILSLSVIVLYPALEVRVHCEQGFVIEMQKLHRLASP